jgi:hypothetical protein
VFEITYEMKVMENLLSAVPLILLLIISLAVYTAWRINKEKKSGFFLRGKRARVPFLLGISVCLIGAYLMAFGEGLLGENHTGIASVIGIVGIGLIGTSGAMFAARAAPVCPEENSNGGKPVE